MRDAGWPFGPMPSAVDKVIGASRIIVQATEDGFFGFAFVGNKQIASMIGPTRGSPRCEKLIMEFLEKRG